MGELIAPLGTELGVKRKPGPMILSCRPRLVCSALHQLWRASPVVVYRGLGGAEHLHGMDF